jgi:flavodoxin
MKTLVIFYSLEGNTKLIAETIACKTGADILELKPKKDVKTKGFMKYLLGGKQVLMKEKPSLLPLDKNIDDYNTIFIGSPVWAGSFAPALKTFFSENKIVNQRVAIFCCHGGGRNGKLFNNIKKEIQNCEILGEIEFRDPLKRDTDINVIKVKEWCDKITR